MLSFLSSRARALLFVLPLLSVDAGAATYYLNPTSGSNSNDGSNNPTSRTVTLV